MSLDLEIDDLFRLPLAEFTSARNALAARLKKEKRQIDAERVKSIAKPPAPAWAVNQLYWENPKAIDKLLAAAKRVRDAQTGRIKNADVRELLAEKKRMTSELVERASAILRAGGHATSPDVMRRVSATLESLAVWGDTQGAPAAGRLTADLDPPGFDALAAVMGGPLPGPARRPAPPQPTPSREAVQAAEKALREARREAAAADAALAKASSEAKKAAQAVADAERALAEAKSGLR